MYLYNHERKLWDNMFSSLVVRGKDPAEAAGVCDAAIRVRRESRADLGPAKVQGKWGIDGRLKSSGLGEAWKEPGSYR